ncbi:MAG: AMP-binding protein, partial [Deltaproteobacteria bacterium]|nr:AMP-binding protein [Deltaproteobacteria bacterium]
MESIYEKRPWLQQYPAWAPHDIEPTRDTALGDFERASARHPEAPALYYFDHVLTYGKIHDLSSRLAAVFGDLGLRKGDRIIIDLQNVPQFPIAAYAAWKVGAIAVPVNPMYKEKELAYFCRDSGAKLFLTLDEIAARLDRSFLKETSITETITTSSLDFLPADTARPSLLSATSKREVPGTLDFMALLKKFKG